MTTPTPPSVITTTKSTVVGRNHTPCGVVVAERVLVMTTDGILVSDGSGEKAIQDIRAQAEALGADAVVDVEIKYKPVRAIAGSIKMIAVSGLAVKLGTPRRR